MAYNTRQRELILGVLKSSNSHLTAQDIIVKLNSSGLSVGSATVYRYLDKLVESGEVRKYIIEEGKSSCYQYIGNEKDCTEHYHLKCSECGKLLHVECDYLDKVESHIFEHHGFSLNSSKTVLYGVCAECSSPQRSN